MYISFDSSQWFWCDVYFVSGQMEESEGHDKVDLELPGQQRQLVLDVINNSKF